MHPACAFLLEPTSAQAVPTAAAGNMMLHPITHLVWRHLEFVLHVDGRGGNEGVHTGTLCMAHCLPGCVQVTVARPESSKGFCRSAVQSTAMLRPGPFDRACMQQCDPTSSATQTLRLRSGRLDMYCTLQ